MVGKNNRILNILKAELLCWFMAALALSACQQRHSKVMNHDTRIPQKRKEVLAKGHHEDSLLVVLNEKGTKEWLLKGRTYHALTAGETDKVKKILKDFWKSGGGDSIWVYAPDKNTDKVRDSSVRIRRPLPYNEYYKQLVAYEESGQTLVHVYLVAIVARPLDGESVGEFLRQHVLIIHDGGKYFGDLLINLNLGKVVGFSLNGEA